MILHYIKRWLPVLLLGLWGTLPATAQEIKSLSPSALPIGSYVTGLYHLEADDSSGDYVREQANTTLTRASLNTSDSGFYFWLVENLYEDYFQLYSASQDMTLMQLNSDGSIQWTTDATSESSKLLFRMYTTGPARTAADDAAGIKATGHITTRALSSGYGNTDCQCNFLTVGGNARFKLHDLGIQAANYRPVVFEKTNDDNNLGSIETDAVNNVTRIIQDEPNSPNPILLPHNFVSSNFFVKGFGEDDFQITISSGAEGYIGFLEYTDHHYTRNVYKEAQSPIGIRFSGDFISLVYRQGHQEVYTNFSVDVPFTLGFKDQDSLVATQNGTTYSLKRAAPAELHFNQSVTQSARMIVSLAKGSVEIAYTTKNRLINSDNDRGTNDGSNLVSTHAFFPYNGGDPLINTFDWEATQWDVRYNAEPAQEVTVTSPFYETGLEFSGIAARFDLNGYYVGGEDFAAVEGWELIKSNLGYNANGSPKSNSAVDLQPPDHPYVMLYDRISGTLRVFVYTNNQGESNQLNVSLSMMGGTPTNQQGYVPRLWGSLQQFASLDQVESSQYSKALPFYGGSGRSWYFADFVMEYDPCIAFFESTIELEVRKTTRGSLSMIGRLEGGSIPAGTTEYENWQNQRTNFLTGVMDNNFGSLQNTLGDVTMNQYENFDLLDFQTEVSGTLVGAAIAPWEKEKAKIEWEATQEIGYASITEGTATIVQGTAQMAEASPHAEPVAKVVGGIATIVEGTAQIASGEAELRLAYANKLYYDAIKDKVNHDDQSISMNVPPPRPQAVFGEMALSGTLSIETVLVDDEEFIATPGGLNSGNAPEWYSNQSRGSEPLYNKPLGRFTLLEQPEFGIGIVRSSDSTNNGGGAWLKIKKKPYVVHNNTPVGKIDDVLSLAIHVQTLDLNGAVQSNVMGDGYTNMFGIQNGNALPGAIDISDLVDWDQLKANINITFTNPTDQDIENELSNWIRVSYEVWSITMTNLKSRNLERVMVNGDQYYTGAGSFAYNSSNSSSAEFPGEAKTLVENEFDTYTFSDDANFGTNYRLYHTDYDEAGDAFYTAMNSYCTALNTAQGAKATGEAQDVKGEEVVAAAEEPLTEELTVVQPGLTVYPNPAQYQVNFRLMSEQAGEARTTLYDLQGRVLVSTTDHLNGRDTLQGKVSIASLPAGIYILEVKLPDGSSVTEKIVKN